MQCRNADKRRLGDVAVLDLDSFTWKRPAVSGTSPSPREGAAAAYHAGHMVLFGMCYSTRPAGFSSVVVAVAQMSRASRHQQASTLAGSNVNLLPPCTVLLLHACRLQVATRQVVAPMTSCSLSCPAGPGPSRPRQGQHPARAAGQRCALDMGATWSSTVAGTTLCWTARTCWTS